MRAAAVEHDVAGPASHEVAPVVLPPLAHVLHYLIDKGPGRTARELADAVYGAGRATSQISFACQLLSIHGRIERCGTGGRDDPHRYYPAGPRAPG